MTMTTDICLFLQVRVLYTRHVDELSDGRPEKRRLDSPEIFYVDNARHPRNVAPVYHGTREPPAITYDQWDDGHHSNLRGARESQPRVALVDNDSPSANVTNYSRPPTYDGKPEVSSFRRLRQLSLPGVGTA